MTPDELPSATRSAATAAQPWRERWFAGLTWKGIGLIVLVCLINALRRTIQNLLGDDTLYDWLVLTAQLTASGLIIAVPVALAIVATYNLASARPRVRYTAVALALAAACIVSIAAAVAVEFAMHCATPLGQCFDDFPVSYLVGAWARYGSLCALFTVVFVYLRIAEECTASAQQAELDRARFVQRMAEARLRMLQAQIEPHFLFNTLANVRRLYRTAPADAASMLDNLMRYFEVALPQMRAADSTLGREVALTESYLNVQKFRMGRRLEFHIDIPSALRETPVPPMMLVTLAENAIKHGLAPLPEGGHVGISATASGAELQVSVADSGRGFVQTSGAGTGLANIRARLAALYGSAGRLTLALNVPRGVIATIAVPLSPSPTAPA